MQTVHPKSQYIRGFTLVGLMIAMTCFAILACLAYPPYQYYLKKARLHQAQSAMLRNSQALDRHYQHKLSYKTNSTTWMTLPIQETEHFCLRLVGNPRGAADGRYNLKAVALDVNNEPRVLKFNQDGLVLVCESSSSRCTEKTHYFQGGSSVDKKCKVFNS